MATDADERFDAKWQLDPVTGCHIWRACKGWDGYGRFTLTHGKQVYAHRYAYERAHGAIPSGLVLDHFVCDRRLCVNPNHVRPATVRENTMRSAVAPAAVNVRKTHCPQGHPYDEANTYVNPQGSRKCRHCAVANQRRYRVRLTKGN